MFFVCWDILILTVQDRQQILTSKVNPRNVRLKLVTGSRIPLSPTRPHSPPPRAFNAWQWIPDVTHWQIQMNKSEVLLERGLTRRGTKIHLDCRHDRWSGLLRNSAGSRLWFPAECKWHPADRFCIAKTNRSNCLLVKLAVTGVCLCRAKLPGIFGIDFQN